MKTTKHSCSRKNGKVFAGLLISTVGFFWLAKKVGWIPVAGGSGLIWPVVIMFLGAVIILFTLVHSRQKHVTGGANQKPF